mgnify:CR=1 FL=1
MRPDVAAYLWDALQAARAARSFTMNAEYSCFVDDTMRRSAVERQLEILGEALNRVRRSDPEVSARIPEIAQIIGMRNIIVHEYGNIDHRLVWEAATKRVPNLIQVLEGLLREADVVFRQ